jgi:16S rRNA (uracil1498-N3)-methyltransferase
VALSGTRPAAHVFVHDDLVGAPSVRLEEEDFYHLARVLRLRPGEVVSASDGAGWVRPFLWTGTATLEPAGGAAFEARPLPELTVAFAITKGAHPEWVVQRLTEAGVDNVVLMKTARCVARWTPTDAARRLARLREVARQAAMQSRRAWLPSVHGLFTFSEVVAGGAASSSRSARPPRSGAAPAGIALAVPGGGPLSLATPMVLVGPEGGWEGEELGSVASHVGLGPHVLRAETAALAAGVLLAALRAHLVAEVTPAQA